MGRRCAYYVWGMSFGVELCGNFGRHRRFTSALRPHWAIETVPELRASPGPQRSLDLITAGLRELAAARTNEEHKDGEPRMISLLELRAREQELAREWQWLHDTL